jgi:glycosyltransferase involved in cell wall biosynthesis
LFVISRFHPYLGGGEVQALRLATGLVSRGHRVTVLTGRPDQALPSESMVEGVRVLRFGRGTFSFLFKAIGFGLLQRRSFELVHAFQALSPSLVAASLSAVLRIPAVVTLLAGGFEAANGDLYLALSRSPLRFLYPRAFAKIRQFVVKSAESAREVRTMLGAESVLIPNGVNTVHFQPAGAVDDRPVACFVGRLEAIKAPEVLFAAWSRVLESLPEARLVVVGGGSDAPRFHELARAAGVLGTLSFMGAQEDVRPFLHEARLLVLSSHSEGMPGVILEAMACGLPAVATDVGHVSQIVLSGDTGLIVPPGDADALGDALLALLTDPQRARAMGRAARVRAEQAFSLDRMVERYETLYRSLLTEGRDGNP